ncbi:MAG TPA: hypothetical protein EYQ46_06305, partial [Myxococcales bacterium]|nr:hypothetical protein [Myxococcales bacterium]
MRASSPDKITRLIVICYLLSVSVANAETFSSVTADTVIAGSFITAPLAYVTSLNATDLSVDGDGASLDVGDSAASLLVEDQLGTGNNGITISPTQTLITGGTGDASTLPDDDDDDIDAESTTLTIDGDGVDFDSSEDDASLDMGHHTISELGDGTELDDAVNLGQLLQSTADEAAERTAADAALASDNADNADAIAAETLRAGNAETVNADSIAAETLRAGN